MLKCSKCSEIAIVETAQPMDHRDISSTVDRTCAIKVAGEVISGVSYYYYFYFIFFFSLVREQPTEKIGHKFRHLFVLFLPYASKFISPKIN